MREKLAELMACLPDLVALGFVLSTKKVVRSCSVQRKYLGSRNVGFIRLKIVPK